MIFCQKGTSVQGYVTKRGGHKAFFTCFLVLLRYAKCEVMSANILKVSLGVSLVALASGFCSAYGEDVSQSYEVVDNGLRKAAEQGHAEAQCQLGDCYLFGKGVSKSAEEALKWYQKAAEQGSAEAQFRLGACWYFGQFFEEAVKWFRMAAEQGHAKAQCSLGSCYYSGKGVSQSVEEAAKWFQKAAEQGHVEAQYLLGSCYYSGQGVSQSFEEAYKWYRKAAEQGHAEAQCILGGAYYSGIGVSQSFEEAAKWFRKAAEQGHERSRKWLSMCPCKTADLLNVAYETSYTEFAESQQKKEKYLYRLGKVNTVLQAWTNLSEHIMNCPSCGSEFKSDIVRPLYQTKSHLDAMRTYLENAVSRGLNGDNDSEDALIKIFEALDRMSKPLRNLPPITIGVG